MLNIIDLQKRHRVYKLKIFLPYIVIFISLLVILLLTLFAKNSSTFKNTEAPIEPIQLKTIDIKPLKKILEKNETIEVLPQEIIQIKEIQALNLIKKEPEKIIIQEIKLEKNIPLKIFRQNTQDDIKHVLKRFKKNNNPALSLFIAKKYYEMQDYHQSYNYALITNSINDNIDASWIIFAKSLFKLGKKDDAIKTLKVYIEHSKSTQAKTILEEMQRGKFI